jgi:hypothetical protein
LAAHDRVANVMDTCVAVVHRLKTWSTSSKAQTKRRKEIAVVKSVVKVDFLKKKEFLGFAFFYPSCK